MEPKLQLRYDNPVCGAFNTALRGSLVLSSAVCLGFVWIENSKSCEKSDCNTFRETLNWAAEKILIPSAILAGLGFVSVIKLGWRWKCSKVQKIKDKFISHAFISTKACGKEKVKIKTIKNKDSCGSKALELALNVTTVACAVFIFYDANGKYYEFDVKDPSNPELIELARRIWDFSLGAVITSSGGLMYDLISPGCLKVRKFDPIIIDDTEKQTAPIKPRVTSRVIITDNISEPITISVKSRGGGLSEHLLGDSTSPTAPSKQNRDESKSEGTLTVDTNDQYKTKSPTKTTKSRKGGLSEHFSGESVSPLNSTESTPYGDNDTTIEDRTLSVDTIDRIESQRGITQTLDTPVQTPSISSATKTSAKPKLAHAFSADAIRNLEARRKEGHH
ncbi:MAG: hypothetical protein H0W88_11510 [Parachlamydiaceae bacterium]|nr:hypothetical protein [Parachlamydiaceae bacterium]